MPPTMNAIIQTRYATPEDLKLQTIERPTPADDEVLVRVHAASIHPDIWHMVTGRPAVLRIMGAGMKRPKNPVPGTDMAGVVESVGPEVTRFKPGDAVFGETLKSHQWQNGGAFAEYVAVHETALAPKPKNVTFEQAAAVPTSALIALHGVKTEGNIQPGQRVLVNGAGGGVGMFALLLAKAHKAQVTAVDHTDKLPFLTSMGADRVIDHTKTDFTKTEKDLDLIVDIPGNHSFAECRRVLAPSGTYVLIGHDHYGTTGRRLIGSVPYALWLVARSRFNKQLPDTGFTILPKKDAMAILHEHLEAGRLTPHIDRTYPLEQVPQAIRHLASGKVLGKIVITIG